MTKEEWQFGQAIAATIRNKDRKSTFREKIARSTCVWRIDVLTAGTGNYVRVLGTEFDVNSKGDEHSVVLVRGAVQVDSQADEETLSYRLVPGQRFSRNPSDGSGNIAHVTTEDYTSWINGYLKFEKLPLGQVILKIQDYYGICICHDGLPEDAYPITGKLDLRTRVDTALVNLEFLAPVNFEKISDNEYRVTMK